MRLSFSIFAAVFLLWPISARPAVVRLCNIEVEAKKEISFSGTEEKWLCGDQSTTAWKSVPTSQQKLFLKSFLQGKGYHKPEITELNGQIHVNAGEELAVRALDVEGGPASWDWSRRWGYLGKPLNPDVLDDTASWAKRELQQRGYPCPKVSSLAFVDTGAMRLSVNPGPAWLLGDFETNGKMDLSPDVLDRFTAYVPGQPFDIRLLELTSNRILAEDLYLSTYFDVVCGDDQQARIVRRFVPALPRLFTVGAGFDTDRGPLARSTMKWTRLGSHANSVEATLFASIREQSLITHYYYHFPTNLASRVMLVPMVSVERLTEKQYITVTTRVGTSLADSWEQSAFQLSGEAGPVLERVNTRRGDGPKIVDNLKLATKLTAMSHLFEYYLSNPRNGWMLSLETNSQFSGVLSEQTVQRVVLQHQVLWNVGSWDPPFLILGWRGMLGSYFFDQRSAIPPDIAVNQKFFLGGDDSIRGFARKELPGTTTGFLTMAYQGFELRTGGWFPLNIQPFAFLDLAKGGVNARKLDRTLYYAPGFGLRYDSPIGTIRASLARGYATPRLDTDPLPHFQFFFSFGREF